MLNNALAHASCSELTHTLFQSLQIASNRCQQEKEFPRAVTDKPPLNRLKSAQKKHHI